MQGDRATRHKYEISHLKRLAMGGVTFKDTQGHYNLLDRPYTSISRNVSGLLLQLYLAPFATPRYYHLPVYVTACDLEKSFTFDNKF